MTAPLSFTLPLRTHNPLNQGQGHGWWKTAKARKEQRALVALWFQSAEARALRQAVCLHGTARLHHTGVLVCVLCGAMDCVPGRRRGPIPRTVTLTRIAPSAGLDSDALPASLKSVRDAIALALGVDDGPRGPITWLYAQARGRAGEYAVHVAFDEQARGVA